jgi:hypothetical protein
MMDHVEALGAGALELVGQNWPEVLPVFAALQAYVSSDRAKHRKKVFEQIFERLSKCEGQLDTEAVKKDGFADIYSETAETFRQTDHDAKVRAAINILSNAFLKDGEPGKIPFSELEFFARSVNELSSGAVHILGRVIGVEEQRNQRPLESLDLRSIANEGVDRDFTIGLLRELEQRHFVHLEFTNMHYEGKRDVSTKSTSLGRRFCKDILE